MSLEERGGQTRLTPKSIDSKPAEPRSFEEQKKRMELLMDNIRYDITNIKNDLEIRDVGRARLSFDKAYEALEKFIREEFTDPGIADFQSRYVWTCDDQMLRLEERSKALADAPQTREAERQARLKKIAARLMELDEIERNLRAEESGRKLQTDLDTPKPAESIAFEKSQQTGLASDRIKHQIMLREKELRETLKIRFSRRKELKAEIGELKKDLARAVNSERPESKNEEPFLGLDDFAQNHEKPDPDLDTLDK